MQFSVADFSAELKIEKKNHQRNQLPEESYERINMFECAEKKKSVTNKRLKWLKLSVFQKH